MKTVFSNDMTCHVWAQQTQSEGRNSNSSIFFLGPIIYSYGTHFPIAKFIDPQTVLFTTATYSNTTQRHVYKVGQSIPYGVKVFNVPNVLPSSEGHHKANLEDYKERILDCLGKASRARGLKDLHLEHAERLNGEATEYASKFGLGPEWHPVSSEDFEKFKADSKALRKRLAKEKQEREDLQRQALADKAAKWLAGEPVQIGAYPDTLLRIKGETVETSKGARFPTGDASKAYRLIKAVKSKGKAWKRNGEQIRLGHFQIDLISKDGDVKAGCHFVRWPEVERIGEALIG